MFWKRFYFVVILLSCNCFLLCSNGSCGGVKKFFGWGEQSEPTTLPADKVEVDNQDDNNINNTQDDKNVIDISRCNISEVNIISPFWCVFFSATTGVGKTSILSHLRDGKFDEKHSTTVGFECFEVTGKKSNEVKMEIQLVDSSGNPECRQGNANYFSFASSAHAIVFVYDITNEESFNSLAVCITEAKKQVPKEKLFFLLGNKFDIVEPNQNGRQVTIDQAQKLALEKGITFLGACSAKANIYMPAQDLYYAKNELLLEDGLKCMLKDIIFSFYKDK